MIEVKNLTKKYGSHTVVKNLNFTIEPGKIYGFLGPNGAGKSTTMNMITGCLAPTEGDVIINGHNILDDPVEAKRAIGYLPEQPPVYPEMTPYEYLRFVAEAKGVGKGDIEDQIAAVMKETRITDMQNRLIKNLSKGYRQRVGIAQAMLGNPKLIILDEPTVGLDPRQIIDIRELIMSLGEKRTVILSSHILAEVSAVCDRVMIISKGNLVASDTLENIRRQYAPENEIMLTVKAGFKKLREVLDKVDGIVKYEAIASDSTDSLYDVTIETETGLDLREAVYRAFSDAGIVLLRLQNSALTLEEVFLKLTSEEYLIENGFAEVPEEEAAEDEDGEDGDDDEDDDGEDEDDEAAEDNDKNEAVKSKEARPRKQRAEDYKPMFGAKKDDGGEDDEQ